MVKEAYDVPFSMYFENCYAPFCQCPYCPVQAPIKHCRYWIFFFFILHQRKQLKEKKKRGGETNKNEPHYSLLPLKALPVAKREVNCRRMACIRPAVLYSSLCSVWPAGRVRWREDAEAALQRPWRASAPEGKVVCCLRRGNRGRSSPLHPMYRRGLHSYWK